MHLKMPAEVLLQMQKEKKTAIEFVYLDEWIKKNFLLIFYILIASAWLQVIAHPPFGSVVRLVVRESKGSGSICLKFPTVIDKI